VRERGFGNVGLEAGTNLERDAMRGVRQCVGECKEDRLRPALTGEMASSSSPRPSRPPTLVLSLSQRPCAGQQALAFPAQRQPLGDSAMDGASAAGAVRMTSAIARILIFIRLVIVIGGADKNKFSPAAVSIRIARCYGGPGLVAEVGGYLVL
jgi:hypothetical protein